MQVRIRSIENEKHGLSYYVQYKRLLFWHNVYWPTTSEGKAVYTDWYYQPFDFTRYFKSYEDADRYVKNELLPPKDKIIKEYETA